MRIGLLNEGTYPYVLGGTSVWCNSMVAGLTEHEFLLTTITSDGREKPVWELPSNVREVRQLPFWARKVKPPTAHGSADAMHSIDDLHRAIVLGPETGLELFESALRRLRGEAVAGRATGLASPGAVAILHSRWRKSITPDLTLRDALNVSDIIEHALRPLWEPAQKVDLNHAVSNGLAMLPALAGLWDHNVPYVLSEHGVYLRERYLGYQKTQESDGARCVLLGFYRMLTALGYRHAAAVVPVSEFNQRWAERVGVHEDRIITIYNGVDPSRFPRASQLGQRADDLAVRNIVWVGRIDPVKDLFTLIRAFARVVEAEPTTRLRLFGPIAKNCESYAQACRELVESLGLEGLGHLRRANKQ